MFSFLVCVFCRIVFAICWSISVARVAMFRRLVLFIFCQVHSQDTAVWDRNNYLPAVPMSTCVILLSATLPAFLSLWLTALSGIVCVSGWLFIYLSSHMHVTLCIHYRWQLNRKLLFKMFCFLPQLRSFSIFNELLSRRALMYLSSIRSSCLQYLYLWHSTPVYVYSVR